VQNDNFAEINMVQLAQNWSCAERVKFETTKLFVTFNQGRCFLRAARLRPGMIGFSELSGH
jgi:hypothetical protein